MAIRKIIRYPAPSLKDPCTPVSFPLSAELLEHIGDLKDTLAATPHGAALASNQILGRGFRVFVVKEGYGLPTVAINPTWQECGLSFSREMESCLSIPEMSMPLERFNEVEISYTDVDGKDQRLRCSGFMARIVQHEVDHLNGKLLADRLNTKDRARLRVRAFNNRKMGR